MQSLLNQYQAHLQGLSSQSSLVPGSRTDLIQTSLVRNSQMLKSSKPSSFTSKPSEFPSFKPSVLDGSKLKDIKKFRTLSVSSIKNYLSDARHFLKYLKTTLQEETILPSQITSITCQDYLKDLAINSPQATLKRRFSSLKRFTSFLVTAKLIDSDPLENQNFSTVPKNTSTTKILTAFTNYLKSEGLSNSTIKNYTSDLNHYLLWATKNTNLTDKHFAKR